jgi:hypothetical protein
MILKAKPINNNIHGIILNLEHYYGLNITVVSPPLYNGFLRIEFNNGDFPKYTKEILTYQSIDQFLRDWIILRVSIYEEYENNIVGELYKSLRDNKLETLLS